MVLAIPSMGMVALASMMSRGRPAIECQCDLGCAETACDVPRLPSGPHSLKAVDCWDYVSGLGNLPRYLHRQMILVGPRSIPEAPHPPCAAWPVNLRTVKPVLTGHSSWPGLPNAAARQFDIVAPGPCLVGDAVDAVQSTVMLGPARDGIVEVGGNARGAAGCCRHGL